MDTRRRPVRGLLPILGLALIAALALGAAPAAATSAYSHSLTIGSGYGSGNGQFGNPGGIATDASGNLYVADTNNNRIQKLNAKGQYVSQFGKKGSEGGQLSGPRDVAADAQGNIFVADTGNNRIQKFNAKGEYVSQFGAKGSGNGQFSSPSSLAIDVSGNIYVGDSGNVRIQKFNAQGEYLTKFGSQGTGDGQFSVLTILGVQIYPELRIAIDPTEVNPWVYVADSFGNRVEMFDASGNFGFSFGEKGSDPGQFNTPSGVAAGPEGLFVADPLNDRVQRFASYSEMIPADVTKDLAVSPEGSLWGITNGSLIEKWIPKPVNGPAFDPSGEFPRPFTMTGGGTGFKGSEIFSCSATTGSGTFLNEAKGQMTLTFTGCGSKSSPGQPSGTIVTSPLRAEPVYLDAAHGNVGLLLTPMNAEGIFVEWGPIPHWEATGSLIVDVSQGTNVKFNKFGITTNSPQQIEEAGTVYGLQHSHGPGYPKATQLIEAAATATLTGGWEAMFAS